MSCEAGRIGGWRCMWGAHCARKGLICGKPAEIREQHPQPRVQKLWAGSLLLHLVWERCVGGCWVPGPSVCSAVGAHTGLQPGGWAMLQHTVHGGRWGPMHRGQLQVGVSSLWEWTLAGLGAGLPGIPCQGCRAGGVPVQAAPVLRVESQGPCGLWSTRALVCPGCWRLRNSILGFRPGCRSRGD